MATTYKQFGYPFSNIHLHSPKKETPRLFNLIFFLNWGVTFLVSVVKNYF